MKISNGSCRRGLSHHLNDADTLRQYQVTNEYHVGLVAYACKKMAEVEEGDDGTTLLDDTMFTVGSNMMDGNTHYSAAFPVILLGGGNCDVKGARFGLHGASPRKQALNEPSLGHGTTRGRKF